jgi:hypothetical protein
MDFYEAGANSQWLLPNRLYEGGLFGAVPVALQDVAVGAWLARQGAGVRLQEDLATTLPAFFAELTEAMFHRLQRAFEAIPLQAFLYDADDCRRIVQGLRPNAALRPPQRMAA